MFKVDFPSGPVDKNPPVDAEDMVRSLVREDPTCYGAAKALHHSW